MTDASPRCTACERPLGTDDRFCSACGTPTTMNLDAEAALLNRAGAEDVKARGGRESEETAVVGLAESATPMSWPVFNARLRQVLGAEYELLSLIGQGGFARVYKARDLRLDRIVAIKVIRPDLIGTRAFMESFRNEGVTLAKLRHPGIVPIYDIRERGGLIYYVMPFVQGTNLDERLNRGRLPPYESRRILGELADALGAAHRAKMVHLDIKPANVFLEGDLQKVLLMDFGIAMALTGQGEQSSRWPVVGTPEYMSPEQARGLSEIDHRSDIYSLGALGYRMLVGRPPFRGRTTADTLAMHVHEAPVSIRDINPTIPKALAEAIMRCLDKDPGSRFPTALELRFALDSVTFFSTREEASARDAPPGVRGNVVTLIAVVALLVGLLVGLALR
ncbi:MAG: serine/threonine-protein kinase [Gemmatimonadales bacterium]